MEYVGAKITVTAYITLWGEDTDLDIADNGQLYLKVSFVQTKDGDKNTLATAVSNATFRNAGTYTATSTMTGVISDSDLYDEIMSNYDISNTQTTLEITKKTVIVEWENISLTPYVYNGEVQGSTIGAVVDLFEADGGNDTQLSVTYYSDTEVTSFKNAGNYSIEATFEDSSHNNNYNLTNATTPLTMNKAEITNIKFDGERTDIVYYYGETYYFFVTSSSDSVDHKEYISTDGSFSITTLFYYQYDAIPMEIVYAGGETAHSTVEGNNGVKNATDGSKQITAHIEETANYKSWVGGVTVNIAKGTLNNIYMNGYGVIYDATPHYVYAKSVSGTTPEYVCNETEAVKEPFELKAPDGSTLVASYTISCATRKYDGYSVAYNHDYNYAIDAGIYVLSATIDTANYEQLVLSDAALEIDRASREVTWEYDNKETADYTYSATDLTSTVRARITKASGGGDVATTEYLAIDITLQGNESLAAALKKAIVVAGEYNLTAAFDSTKADYAQLMNNYTITGNSTSFAVKKYTVEIVWKYSCDCHEGEVYDIEDACMYNAADHGVLAVGLGVGGVIIDTNTSGTFTSKNAGEYTATVESIVDDNDTITLGGVNYSVPYALNYQLENLEQDWQILKRPVTISVDVADTSMSKVYDGTPTFTLDNNVPVVVTYDPQTDGTTTISVVYTLVEKAKDNGTNTFVYTIGNVMDADKTTIRMMVNSLSANSPNVVANGLTVSFEEFVSNEATQNYEITQDVSEITFAKTNIIIPQDIYIILTKIGSHVYNGETYAKTFTYEDNIHTGNDSEGLFVISRDEIGGDNLIASLVEGNNFVGSIGIGGATAAGNYELDSNGFATATSDGVANYTLHMVKGAYRIDKRNLVINYTHSLQSFKSTFADVGYTVDKTNSQHDDLIKTGSQSDETALQNLLTADGYAITIVNKWKDSTYDSYTRIVGTDTADAPLQITTNSNNYLINLPVLQLTYLAVSDENNYYFDVQNINDLLQIESDVYGLQVTREDYHIGKAPTYTQSADIDCYGKSGYTFFKTVHSFKASYNGNNHKIKGLTIVRADSDTANVGLFGIIDGGSITNLYLCDVNIYADNNTFIGALAGQVKNASISNIKVSGHIYAKFASYNIGYVGGLFGKVDNSTLTNIDIAVEIHVDTNVIDNLYVGGLAGETDNCTQAISGVRVFADTVVWNSKAISGKYGGVFGKVSDSSLVDNYYYLSNGIFVDNQGTYILKNTANGDNATVSAYGRPYEQIVGDSNPVSSLITSDIVRSYLLPAGADGTGTHPVNISTYRHIGLMFAYSYMNFTVNNTVTIPYSTIATYRKAFSGTITIAMTKEINAPVSANKNLFAVTRASQEIIVKKKES